MEMLEALSPDICSVATGGHEYGSEHHLPTMQALEYGCHVLGEKPIANEIPAAEEMVAKAREQGLCYGINLNHRFTPAALLAKRWQDEGKHRAFALHEHEYVDHESARIVALFSAQSPAPPYGRYHALLLW